VGDIDQGHGCT